MTNETNKKPLPTKESDEKVKKELIKKQKAKAETAKFKSKYFEYYDDIKQTPKDDW